MDWDMRDMRSGRQGSWGVLSPGLGLGSDAPSSHPLPVLWPPQGPTASSLPPPSFLPTLSDTRSDGSLSAHTHPVAPRFPGADFQRSGTYDRVRLAE